MKNLLLFIFILIYNLGFCQNEYKGKIIEADTKEQLPGVSITVNSSDGSFKGGTHTDINGTFAVSANLGDILEFFYIGFLPSKLVIDENTELNFVYELEPSIGLEGVVVTGVGSSSSSWVGATLAYNLDGNSSENVIGAAKVKINTVKRFDSRFRLNVIGNITKFSGVVEIDELDRGIRDLIQSSQGLSVGMEPLIFVKDTEDTKLRVWGNLNYKLNQFQDVEINSISENVSISQFRVAAGGEVEAFKMLDGERFIHLGIEISKTYFDENKYQMVFNDSKSSLLALEWSFILPLNGSLGIVFGQVLSPDIKSTFNAGIIIAGN